MDVFLPKTPKQSPQGTSSQNGTRISTPSNVPHQKKKKKMKETCQGKVIIHTGVLVMESFLVKIFTQKLEHPLMGSKTNEITKERRTHCFQMWLFGISTGQRGVVCWVLVEGVPG